MHRASVEGDRLHAPVGGEEDRSTGSLVDAAGLHADKAVLDEIQPPDAIVVAKLVQLRQHRRRRQTLPVDGHGVAPLEVQGENARAVRRVLRRDGPLVHEFRRLDRGVFQHLALRGRVQEVRVDRERRLAALVLRNRDLVLFGEGDQRLAALEVPLPPGRDHPDVRLQRVVAQLEAHLVVALAGRAVTDRIGADLPRNVDLGLGDQRPGDGGAEEILALIDRVGAEHREDVVAHELFAQILDKDVFGLDAEQQRLFSRRAKFLALPEIGGEGHNLRIILGLKPLQDDRGVEAAGIGQHDFLHGGGGHGRLRSRSVRGGGPPRDNAAGSRALRIDGRGVNPRGSRFDGR